LLSHLLTFPKKGRALGGAALKVLQWKNKKLKFNGARAKGVNTASPSRQPIKAIGTA
jgi:hypothetical protein